MSDFSNIEILTFDCYGTLIDWESGITQAVGKVLEAHDKVMERDELLERYAVAEAEIESDRYRPYRDILTEIMKQFCRTVGIEPKPAELTILVDSLPDWPPFDDTVASLRQLSTKFKLAVISNIDDDLFEATRRTLEVDLDFVITAAQVGAYKPDLAVFSYALGRIGRPKDRFLHCAQSLYHDIAPARALGLHTVWINRREGLSGFGATLPTDANPDYEVPDLKSLTALLEM
jgi:2-haloacid dehalogenase